MYGMIDRENSLREAALPVPLALSFLWRAHAGSADDVPFAVFALRPAFADTLRLLLLQDAEEAKGGSAGVRPAFVFPRALLCCGSSDFLLPGSQLVAARLTALGCAPTLRVYPGHHAFFGLPPGWTMHGCYHKSMPCARDVLDFMQDTAQETSMADFVTGNMPAPLLEPTTVVIAAMIVVVLPIVISLGPLMLLFGLVSMSAELPLPTWNWVGGLDVLQLAAAI